MILSSSKRIASLVFCFVCIASSPWYSCSAFFAPKSLLTSKTANIGSKIRLSSPLFSKSSSCYDVIIVGGGPMGLSAAYECAKDKKKVLLLERFFLYNQSGSSNDMVRMFRTMYTEDYMAKLAKQAMDAWAELECDAGVSLIERSGLLNFGDPNYKSGPEGNLKDPIKNLKSLNMRYQELSVKEIEKNFPFCNLPSHYEGLWAPDNGCINVPEMLRQLTRLCEETSYVDIVEFAKVQKIDTSTSSDEIKVYATIGEEEDCQEYKSFHGQKGIITAGAYTNHILDPSFNFRLDLDIWEMVYEYYDCSSREEYPATEGAKAGTLESISGKPFKSMWFQFAENDKDAPEKSNLFYGFPVVPWGIKNNARIAVDHAIRRIRDPSERKIGPASFDLQNTQEFVNKHLKGVLLQPNYAGTCLQANVYDNMFVLDHLPPSVPNHKNIAVFTAGWGMKFVPVIGKALKELIFVDEKDYSYDLSYFKITRSDSSGSVILDPSKETDSSTSTFRKTFTGSSLSRGPSLPPILKSETPLSTLKAPFSHAAYGRKVAPSLKIKTEATSSRLYHGIKADSLNIGIIGGGVSGLYAAMILKDIEFPASIDILEANPKRFGGRIFTKYFGNSTCDNHEHKYYDVGAMRFPKIPIHDRVIGDQPWSLVNYLNCHLGNERDSFDPIKLVPYYYSEDGNLKYFNGIKKKDVNIKSADPDPFDFNLTPSHDMSSDKLLDFAIKEVKEALINDFNSGFETLMKYDKLSVRAYMQNFLKQIDDANPTLYKGKYPDKVIDMIETLESSTGMYSRAALTETVIDEFDFAYKKHVQWTCVDGGTYRIIDAMEKVLDKQDAVTAKKGARVRKITHCKTSDKMELEVEMTNSEGKKEKKTRSYNHVISTLPFSVLRSIDTSDLDLSREKLEATRVLSYDSSCKVGIWFEKRWWQDEKAPHPISGGQSSTDLPSRTIVYPSYGDVDSPGVLIASYTWTMDADRISALSHEGRVEVCLRDLEEIHGPIVREQKILGHHSHSWYDDEYSQGAFALFGPGQFSTHFENSIKEEVGGRLHFAGEATSVHHAWIVGSLNSAYRTVAEILATRPQEEKKMYLNKLLDKWGKVDEIEIVEEGESPFAENGIRNEETISSETSKTTYADILKKGFEYLVDLS